MYHIHRSIVIYNLVNVLNNRLIKLTVQLDFNLVDV